MLLHVLGLRALRLLAIGVAVITFRMLKRQGSRSEEIGVMAGRKLIQRCLREGASPHEAAEAAIERVEALAREQPRRYQAPKEDDFWRQVDRADRLEGAYWLSIVLALIGQRDPSERPRVVLADPQVGS